MQKRKEIAVAFEGVCKKFPPNILANDYISFEVEKGTIRAILGENGAGKTTLMNILYGLYQPDEGKILIKGKPVQISSPQKAIELGIGMVHQNFKLVETNSVIENIILGLSSVPFFEPVRKIQKKIEEMSQRYGLKIDLAAKIWQLSAAEQQCVEILKALYRQPEIIIWDESTSVLTPKEVNDLFLVLRKMKEEDKTCLFITHKLKEVMEISDQVTILRKGKVVGNLITCQTTIEELAQKMIGQKISFSFSKKKEKLTEKGEIVLRMREVDALGDRRLMALKNISFEVHQGEIVGLAGVTGNGQRELAETIIGLRQVGKGKISINGVDITNSSPREIAQQGVAYIPEDRQFALVSLMSIAENFRLRDYNKLPFAKGLWFDWNIVLEHAHQMIDTYNILPPLPQMPVRLLSGGNRQRVILAREFVQNPKLIIASNPTAGLDVGGAETIFQLFLEMQQKGAGILLISGDLDEILVLADTILVIFRGEIIGRKKGKEEGWTEKDRTDLGLMMGGVKLESEVKNSV